MLNCWCAVCGEHIHKDKPARLNYCSASHAEMAKRKIVRDEDPPRGPRTKRAPKGLDFNPWRANPPKCIPTNNKTLRIRGDRVKRVTTKKEQNHAR